VSGRGGGSEEGSRRCGGQKTISECLGSSGFGKRRGKEGKKEKEIATFFCKRKFSPGKPQIAAREGIASRARIGKTSEKMLLQTNFKVTSRMRERSTQKRFTGGYFQTPGK